MIKYGSVCSGVEAASLAWMPLGWEAVWFSEIEPFPCAVLRHRFPNVPNLGDMTKIRVETLENGDQNYYGDNGTAAVVPGGVDLLVGGTPCQGFSVAGKQGGLEDDRSVLCLTFVRLLREMRPRFFVWENVPGVLSTAGGADFFEFIRQITESGYCCAWRILDAQYVRVDGFPRAIPQRRRRMFVVGCLGADWELPAKILFEPQSLLGDTPPRRVKGKGFTTGAERVVGETGRAFYMKSFAKPVECDALTVTAHIHKGISNESPVILDNPTALSGEKDAVFWDRKDVAGTLTSASGGPNTSGPTVMSRATVRRLLPIECERLMGFLDNWTKIPYRGKFEEDCPDSPRYKACGNSMCVNVMQWIGKRIDMVTKGETK